MSNPSASNARHESNTHLCSCTKIKINESNEVYNSKPNLEHQHRVHKTFKILLAVTQTTTYQITVPLVGILLAQTILLLVPGKYFGNPCQHVRPEQILFKNKEIKIKILHLRGLCNGQKKSYRQPRN